MTVGFSAIIMEIKILSGFSFEFFLENGSTFLAFLKIPNKNFLFPSKTTFPFPPSMKYQMIVNANEMRKIFLSTSHTPPAVR
jgi:hypothetical protein